MMVCSYGSVLTLNCGCCGLSQRLADCGERGKQLDRHQDRIKILETENPWQAKKTVLASVVVTKGRTLGVWEQRLNFLAISVKCTCCIIEGIRNRLSSANKLSKSQISR